MWPQKPIESLDCLTVKPHALRSVILTQYQSVTDGRTDGQFCCSIDRRVQLESSREQPVINSRWLFERLMSFSRKVFCGATSPRRDGMSAGRRRGDGDGYRGCEAGLSQSSPGTSGGAGPHPRPSGSQPRRRVDDDGLATMTTRIHSVYWRRLRCMLSDKRLWQRARTYGINAIDYTL